jgi:phosphatidylserine/phosphatidylglycerophosphate/cardiolipin synthase-like enzyme
VRFNQRQDTGYRSPVDGRNRPGENLEQLLIETIRSARQEVLVAVQELSLPGIAKALVERHRAGVAVKVVVENIYRQPWSLQQPAGLNPHQQQRLRQLRALGGEDAMALLDGAAVPVIDDREDGSAGSGLMHHKFVVVDRQVVVVGSSNFSSSDMHGDADAPSTRGNVNHLLRIHSSALAGIFADEFNRLWGDGPGGSSNSLFGLEKQEGAVREVDVSGTPVKVLFAPHKRSDPNNGLALLQQVIAGAQQSIDMALFVFSAQELSDALAARAKAGVKLRVLVDPGFASRSYSEILDLMGIVLPDRNCKIEAANRPWAGQLTQMVRAGSPKLVAGDKLHHKLAIIDAKTVVSGSFNWSPAAANRNDETLMVIESPQLAAHFNREMERLWSSAELGPSRQLERKQQQIQRRCGLGIPAEKA